MPSQDTSVRSVLEVVISRSCILGYSVCVLVGNVCLQCWHAKARCRLCVKCNRNLCDDCFGKCVACASTKVKVKVSSNKRKAAPPKAKAPPVKRRKVVRPQCVVCGNFRNVAHCSKCDKDKCRRCCASTTGCWECLGVTVRLLVVAFRLLLP